MEPSNIAEPVANSAPSAISSTEPNRDAEASELARLQAECNRLAELVKRLQVERDGYRQAAYAWALQEITDRWPFVGRV